MSEPAQVSLFELEPVAIVAEGEPPAEIPAPELRDPRQMAFSVVGNGAAARLRSSFTGQRLTTALAVYGAITQLASEARSPGEVRASRTRVSAYAGVTVPTVDRYVKDFERVRLVEVVRPRGGRDHLGNLWRLLSVDGDARGQIGDEARGQIGDIPSSRGQTNRTPNDVRGQTKWHPVCNGEEERQRRERHPARARSRRGGSSSDFSHYDKVMQR